MRWIACILVVVMIFFAGCSAPAESQSAEQRTVLVDDGVVKATFVEVFEVSGFCYLRLLVENKTDREISVYLTDAYVNDMAVTMMSGVPMDIASGKMSQNPFIFSGFSEEDVAKIEFRVLVFDENMSEIEKTETLKIERGDA